MSTKKKILCVLLVLPIVVMIALLILEIGMAKKSSLSESVAYREKSDITYRVHMKANNYGLPEYVDEQYNIIASLIDSFDTGFNYLNTFSSEVEYEIAYNVTAQLQVYDSLNDQKPIYTKDYIIVPEKVETGKGLVAKVDLLNQEIKYDEYNSIVNELKREIIPTANLVIKFNTKFKGKSNVLDDEIVSNKTSTLTIPISQKTLNIDVNKNVNPAKEETLSNKKKVSMGIIVLIVATSLMLIVFVVIFVIHVSKCFEKKSAYDIAVNKILREFDRAITESKNGIKITKKMNKIIINDFMELLDVHDNFNIPIIYHKINNDKCEFIVKNEDDIYYYCMKSDDYNNK